MEKIDRVEDLPEWFDLEKYQEAESFGAAEWHYELFRRAQLFKINQRHDSLSKEERELKIAIFNKKAHSIRETPIATLTDIPIETELNFMPVKSISIFDLRMQALRDERAQTHGLCHQNMVERWHAIGDPKYPIISAAGLLDTPININFYDDRPPLEIIKVDLSLSDSALKAAFDIWLKEARKNQEKDIIKSSKPFYSRWARYGLLPYLDLLTWAMETDTRIPDRVMSTAISCYDKGEANLRKTIAPLASDLMRDLSELESLAVIEATARALANPEILGN